MPSKYVEKVNKGLCGQCGNHNDRPERTTCSHCAKKKSIRSKAMYSYRKLKNNCLDCGSPALEKRVRCESCLIKQKMSQFRNREKKY